MKSYIIVKAKFQNLKGCQAVNVDREKLKSDNPDILSIGDLASTYLKDNELYLIYHGRYLENPDRKKETGGMKISKADGDADY